MGKTVTTFLPQHDSSARLAPSQASKSPFPSPFPSPQRPKSATHQYPFIELLEQARRARKERRGWWRRRRRVRVLKAHTGRPHPLRILRVLWMLRVLLLRMLLRIRHHLARGGRRRWVYSGGGAMAMRSARCAPVCTGPRRPPGRSPCPWRCSRFPLVCLRLLAPAGSCFRLVRHVDVDVDVDGLIPPRVPFSPFFAVPPVRSTPSGRLRALFFRCRGFGEVAGTKCQASDISSTVQA